MESRRSVTHNRKGQSMVETALVLPIILLIVIGTIEFGRILSAWMVITHASREGARMASLGASGLEVEQRVDAVSDSLDLTNLTVTISPSGSLGRGDMVTVNVTYSIDLMTPFIGAVVGDTLDMDAETTMRVE